MEAWGSEGPRARGTPGQRRHGRQSGGEGKREGPWGDSGPWGLWCMGGLGVFWGAWWLGALVVGAFLGAFLEVIVWIQIDYAHRLTTINTYRTCIRINHKL